MITGRAGRVKHVVSTAVDKSGLAQLSVKHSGAGNGLKKTHQPFWWQSSVSKRRPIDEAVNITWRIPLIRL